MLNRNLLNEVKDIEMDLKVLIMSDEDFLRFIDDERIVKESKVEWTYKKIKGIYGEDLRQVFYRTLNENKVDITKRIKVD